MASWENDSERLIAAFQGVQGVCALWSCEKRRAPKKTVYVKAAWVSWRLEILFDPSESTWTVELHEDHKDVRRVAVSPDQDVFSVALGEWRSRDAASRIEESQ